MIHDIQVNPADGSLWIADSRNNRVRAVFDAANAPGDNIPTGGTAPPPPPGDQGRLVPGASGYWMLGVDGRVFAFGDARFWGSTGNMKLNKPVLSLVPTRTNRGYWLVASDGGIFAFSEKGFAGSLGANPPARAIVFAATLF